jgi:hypothetical protein
VALFKRQYELKSPDKVLVDLDSYARTQTVEIGKRDAVRAHQTALADLFAAFGRLGASTRFVYLSGDLPVIFAMADGGLVLVVSGFVSDKTYNSARLNGAERAGQAIQLSAIPALKAFAGFAKVGDVKFYGLSVVYGSRDFNGDAPSAAESVAFIVPADRCRAFIDGAIGVPALFEASDVYLSAADSAGGIEKLKLGLKWRRPEGPAPKPG